MPRTIKRSGAPTVDIDKLVTEYLNQRMLRERSTTTENQYKADLMALLEKLGSPSGEMGKHRTLELTDPLPYGKKIVTAIERQCRISTTLDEERTMTLLTDKGLLDRCTKTVVVLDEDAVLVANYEGRISDEELAGLYDKSESFAFQLKTEVAPD
jgi:hypothetical protein